MKKHLFKFLLTLFVCMLSEYLHKKGRFRYVYNAVSP